MASESGLTQVGSPFDLFRVLDPVYLDQARLSFKKYVTETLAANASHGGRFSPRGEFGALYTSLEEETAWAEVLHRFEVEGIEGLPPEMAVLRMSAQAGQYADVVDAAGCQEWEVSLSDLVADKPDAAQQHACWQLARAVRTVGDGLQCPSARDQHTNMPLYPDRPNSELSLVFVAGVRKAPPPGFAQRSQEQW
jgi:RES domain-containing protein